MLIRQLFQPDEVAFYRDHYTRLRENGSYPGDLVSQGADPGTNDPLKRYPRMIHMHRWDEVSLRWMIDKRLNACMTALLGVEPFAVQTMLYFKPPGAGTGAASGQLLSARSAGHLSGGLARARSL